MFFDNQERSGNVAAMPTGPARREERNPLHEKALQLSDVKPNVKFITFNTQIGITKRGRFASKPTAKGTRAMVVLDNRERYEADLGDLGIAPYEPRGVWNETNFSVRARDERQLPTLLELDPKLFPKPRRHRR